jgi:hypothetical protein
MFNVPKDFCVDIFQTRTHVYACVVYTGSAGHQEKKSTMPQIENDRK